MAKKRTDEDLQAELARLRSENNAMQKILKARKLKEVEAAVWYKVTPKGAVTVYFTKRRFPVTLNKHEWDLLLANQDGLKQFMKENEPILWRPDLFDPDIELAKLCGNE